jgi:hypothetical protein
VGGLLYTYLHPSFGANQVIGLLWQLVSGIQMEVIMILHFVNDTQKLHLYNGLPEGWVACHVNIYTHYPELMKSLGCHGNLSLLLMMKVMIILHFVNDS